MENTTINLTINSLISNLTVVAVNGTVDAESIRKQVDEALVTVIEAVQYRTHLTTDPLAGDATLSPVEEATLRLMFSVFEDIPSRLPDDVS